MTVQGTAEVPKGQRLWVVVEAEPDTQTNDRTFYLQGDRAVNGGRDEFRGNWSEDDVFLGAG